MASTSNFLRSCALPAVAILAATSLLLVPSAQATPQSSSSPDASPQLAPPGTQDASCQVPGGGAGSSSFTDPIVVAQTFTAQHTGQLTSVQVLTYSTPTPPTPPPPPPTTFEIRAVDNSGVPTATVLATTTADTFASAPAQFTAVFFNPTTVIAGGTYAVALHIDSPGVQVLPFSVNQCPEGALYIRQPITGSFSPAPSGADTDMNFTIFVTTFPPGPPGTAGPPGLSTTTGHHKHRHKHRGRGGQPQHKHHGGGGISRITISQ